MWSFFENTHHTFYYISHRNSKHICHSYPMFSGSCSIKMFETSEVMKPLASKISQASKANYFDSFVTLLSVTLTPTHHSRVCSVLITKVMGVTEPNAHRDVICQQKQTNDQERELVAEARRGRRYYKIQSNWNLDNIHVQEDQIIRQIAISTN